MAYNSQADPFFWMLQIVMLQSKLKKIRSSSAAPGFVSSSGDFISLIFRTIRKIAFCRCWGFSPDAVSQVGEQFIRDLFLTFSSSVNLEDIKLIFLVYRLYQD
jgi:hypothetical protein